MKYFFVILYLVLLVSGGRFLFTFLDGNKPIWLGLYFLISFGWPFYAMMRMRSNDRGAPKKIKSEIDDEEYHNDFSKVPGADPHAMAC